jgi:dipeptidyl aminopeptidase/acylaminoacyl peptidase
MTQLSLIVLLALSIIGCSGFQPKDVPKYSAQDFFNTTTMWGRGFSHDEKNIMVISDESGIYNTYQYPIDGSKPIALSKAKKEHVVGIGWMPGDRGFLYSAEKGGNELTHVYYRDKNGKDRDLTPGKKVKASYQGFNKTLTKFYVFSNKRNPKFMDLYEYDVKTFKSKLIYKNTDNFSPEGISPNGKWLSLSKTNSNSDSNLYLVDLTEKNAKPKLLTKHEGQIVFTHYDFSANDDYLLYGTNANGEFFEVMKYDFATGAKTSVYKTNWDVSFAYHSYTGKYRVIGVNHDAQTRIKIMDLKTDKEVDLPKLPEGNIGNINFSRSDTKMMFSIGGDRSPRNMFVIDLETKKFTKLTDTMNPKIASDNLVDGEVIRYKSFDDLEIPSILYRPRFATSKKKVPAIVYVHGGPGGQSRKGYRPLFQYLANQGYAILAVNNRGSSGYGKTFYHMDDKKHGDVDLKDCIYGSKYLESLDWVDSQRIGIMGGSYGGYMVLAALAFAPESFNMGIDIYGVSNWVRTLKSIPSWWESFKKYLYDELGDPATDEKRLRSISPVFHAKNIVKPLMVIQGKNDPRVLMSESDDIVNAVKKNKVPVEYVIFEDEGHGFTKKVNRIKAANSYIKFLKQHL